MDRATADILNELTTRFYTRCADSFSRTRTHAWQGWERCLDACEMTPGHASLNVLDVGCGNMRFESFLSQQGYDHLEVWSIDTCKELVYAGDNIIRHDAEKCIALHFNELDIISSILDGQFSDDMREVPSCDLSCAFGVMHHLPGAETRRALLDLLIDKTRPDGHILVSLWQFTHDERLARKAHLTTSKARELCPDLSLDEGDWLLGWQDDANAMRYCHDFSDAEVDALVEHVAGRARLVDRFNADGKNGTLNCYLVFQRTEG